MKRRSLEFLILISLISIVLPGCLYAQKPVVAIFAWDDKAKEASDPGEFHIIQLGEPVPDLEVKINIEGTASDGFDYRCFSDTWTLTKKKAFRVLPIDDGIEEGDETVVVNLLESPDYDIEEIHSSARVVIQDNFFPDVEFEAASSTAFESKKTVDLKVKLSRAIHEEVEVQYSVRGVMAEQGEDFILEPGSVIIPAGEKEGSIRLKILDDERAEADETIIIRLLEARNANIETRHAHYFTIRNDDGPFTESVVYDRILGATLGFRAGCSMGAVTEYNWDRQRIESTFGLLEEFRPFVHYGDSWSHPAGSTEDGGERHKLICTAIMEKQDRISYEDLKDVWLRYCEIENMYRMTQNYDRVLLKYVEWGVPPDDLPVTKYGKPSDLGEHIHLTARTFQALPCINAGDPENTIADMKEMGKMYYEDPEDDAFAWGAVYNAAMAIAMLPGATVESVIEGALEYATPEIEREIRYAIAITEKYDDPMDREMWQELNDMYYLPDSKYNAFARIEKYPNSSVYENVGYAFALFKATRADVRQSIIIAVNRGYDTDCTAASAGALCGALTGTSTIPEDWIKTLDSGIANTPYTNAHFMNKATADGLFFALQNKVHRMEKEARALKKNSPEKEKLDAYTQLMRKARVIE